MNSTLVEQMKDTVPEEIIKEIDSSASLITRQVNICYALACDKGVIFPSEETYRTFFMEFITKLFGIKELSMKRHFNINMIIKKED